MLGHRRHASKRHLNGVSLACRWWPAYSGIWILPPLIKLTKTKKKVKVGPPLLTKLSGSAHDFYPYNETETQVCTLIKYGWNKTVSKEQKSKLILEEAYSVRTCFRHWKYYVFYHHLTWISQFTLKLSVKYCFLKLYWLLSHVYVDQWNFP